MLKSILKTSVYITCLVWSGIACAAGLGGINVTSALGQPLKAEIELVSVDKIDKTTLIAKLASADAYKNTGLDYPYSLPKIKFQIESRASGEPYVKVTSVQPVNDPFVTLLVELSWSSGKLLREYTFLLDPPGYQPEQPVAEEVTPIEPVLAVPALAPAAGEIVEPELAAAEPEPAAAESLAETPAAEAVEQAPTDDFEAAPAAASAAESAAALAEEAAPSDQVPAAQSAPVEAAPAAEDALSKEEAIAETAITSSEPIVVKSGDTLTKIAASIKPADVSLERMLVALYRENAGVFDAHNMNRIRAGKILKVPQSEAVRMLPQADAEEEIQAQAADWNAYRQKLAAARGAAVERADKQEAAGKISAAVIDKAVAEKGPAKEVLKLSKGEAPSDKAVGGGKPSAEDKAISKEEEAIATSKALEEAQERTAILEKNVKDMQRLEQMKKETAAASAPAASAPAMAVPMSAASAPTAASSVAEAKPRPKVEAPKVVEQPSLVDQLLGEPLYLGGAAALLLALGGAGFVAARRGKLGGKKKVSSALIEEDAGGSTGRIAAPIAPSPDTGDFTHAAAATVSAAADTEEVDPIGEADLFLTFGRDAQAEEVLKEALKKTPNNIPVKLKLLSIYVTRKDTNSFYSYAREIKEAGDESAWEQTARMGRELEPSNPFYGGTAGAAQAVEGKPATASAAPAVDFDLGFGAASAASGFSSQNTVVLETPTHEKTSILSAEELRAAQSTPMDFDVTGTNPRGSAPGGAGEPAALSMDDLVFDVTATHPGAPASLTAPAPAAPAPAEDLGLAFTLDFPITSKMEEAPAKPAPAIGLGEISLNLDSFKTPAAPVSTEPKNEQWHEVATKLDLAKAYQEMGDASGAREILEEVMRDGDEQQRATAQALLQQL